jgi:hypothetical protein
VCRRGAEWEGRTGRGSRVAEEVMCQEAIAMTVNRTARELWLPGNTPPPLL